MSSSKSEDCLSLNVWTLDPFTSARLPVLVYFYGGGFMDGDGSEPRDDGMQMARKCIVTVTMYLQSSILAPKKRFKSAQNLMKPASSNLRPLTRSPTGIFTGGLPQPFHVTHGWFTEEALILPAEI